MACILHLLHPPSTLAQGTAAASPSSRWTERQPQALPQPRGQKTSPFLQGHRCTPRPHTLYFICARALEAQSEAAGNSKPRGLGKQRHTQTNIRNEVAEQQEKMNVPRRAALVSDKRWTHWGLLISGRKWIRRIGEKHPLDKQNCKGRLAASVLEVFRKRQQST